MNSNKQMVFVDIYKEFSSNLKLAVKHCKSVGNLSKKLGVSRNIIYTWMGVNPQPAIKSIQLVKNYVDNVMPNEKPEEVMPKIRGKIDIKTIVSEVLGDKE